MQSFYNTVHQGRILDGFKIGKDRDAPPSLCPSQDEQITFEYFLLCIHIVKPGDLFLPHSEENHLSAGCSISTMLKQC
jgi:hypothetical protein